MQNRSIFPYRRHGPKKRGKHGSNHKQRGSQKGLPNSARDLLPMLQPATKALAQVLAGRAGASGQLGHARTMLAQAERMIGERAHNRLTPAEREEFFEQLARLKLTLADADAEAEVQAEEQESPRAQMPPVGQERLMEMALALSMPQRSGQSPSPRAPAAAPGATREMAPREPAMAASTAPTAAEATPQDEAAASASGPSDNPASGSSGSNAAGGRLVLPKANADQGAQAVAFSGIGRRRSRATSRGAKAAAAMAADDSVAASKADPPGSTPAPTPEPAATQAPTPNRIKVGMKPALGAQPVSDEDGDAAAVEQPPARTPARLRDVSQRDGDGTQRSNGNAAEPGKADNGAEAETEAPAPAKTSRRSRKAKTGGLPEGWVIDDEGFVVPGAD